MKNRKFICVCRYALRREIYVGYVRSGDKPRCVLRAVYFPTAAFNLVERTLFRTETENFGINLVFGTHSSITLLSRIIDLLRECRVAIGTASGRSQ